MFRLCAYIAGAIWITIIFGNPWKDAAEKAEEWARI